MTDPGDVVEGIERARDAFEYVGHGSPDYETAVSRADAWRTQLTKACRYLASTRTLRAADGFNGAVVELCFAAIERSLEGYVLWSAADELSDFRDHETVYDRAAERGLFERETTEALQELYGRNRTAHYYGSLVPTQAKADAMFAVAADLHDFATDQIREGGVCVCE